MIDWNEISALGTVGGVAATVLGGGFAWINHQLSAMEKRLEADNKASNENHIRQVNDLKTEIFSMQNDIAAVDTRIDGLDAKYVSQPVLNAKLESIVNGMNSVQQSLVALTSRMDAYYAAKH
jgi:predicted  nucleic acid-binding Zn-ribbon protein